VTVESLDAASARLQNTLESLRSTLVEPAFRPANEAPKYLFDFVDEGGISDLESTIKSSIDRFDAARLQLAETCEAFEADLERLHTNISPDEPSHVEALHGETPLPALIYQLETKATEAASHLEGLVKHYDLCVTALKHTEGGGDAILQASAGEEEQAEALVGLGVDLGKLENAPAKAISNEERLEMLNVLVTDAGEVDEVVADIKDSLVEMEDSMSHITTYLEGLRDASTRLRDALAFLKEVTGKLPIYISACAEFQRAWDEQKELLHEKLAEIEGLRDFYAGFEDAYDELILEIQRRRQVRQDMEKVIKSATQELEALYKGQSALHQPFPIPSSPFSILKLTVVCAR
jgi:autophagy-related protein 17